MKKRILASLLALCFMGGMLPTTMLAAKPDTTISTAEQKLEKNDEAHANRTPSAPAFAGAEENSSEHVLVSAGEGEAPTSGTCGENLTWELDLETGTLTISGTGEMTDYLSNSPWRSNADIKSIVLNDGITSIGNNAFYECRNLVSVSIPSSVIRIGYKAFEYCSGLSNITIPSGVINIDDFAFSYCSSLTGDITIPSTVTNIGKYAFNYCSNLTSILIPDSVIQIGDHAFSYCSSLKNITLPSYITSIENFAFYECSALESISIPNRITNIGYGAFGKCKNLVNINIPESVICIDNAAFSGCSSLSNIILPNNITSIGNNAFSDCSKLTNITIPDSVISIGNYVFYECSELANAVLSCNISQIGDYVFYGCGKLTDISIPQNVTSIGEYAFYECSGLMDIDIPKKVTEIGEYAFAKCSGLKNISIPTGVTSIDGYTFWECSGLISVTIPNTVTNIEDAAFNSCSNLESISIPNSVTYIGDSAFHRCGKLNKIIIPGDVTYIGESAFSGCNGLTEIAIPDGITEIKAYTFSSCENLGVISLPSSITNIGLSAFDNCEKLSTIYYASSTSNWSNIEIGNHNDCLSNATIYYNSTGPDSGTTTPDGRTTAVKYLTNWNTDTKIASFAGDADYIANDDTDMSFVENIDTLLNRYVLVESVVIDGSTMQLLSIQPVDSALGTCTAQTETEVTIDGISYPWESDFSSDESSLVLYHTLNGNLVGVNFLVKEVSTDLHWDSTKNELSSSMRSYPINYMTDMETVNEYKVYCEEHSIVETTVYYADFGSYQPLMMVYGAEQGYYGNTADVDKSSPKYIINQSWNEWYDAYEGYISALEQALEQAQDEDVDRAASIEAQAEAMKEADSKTYDRILTFDPRIPEEWQLYCYQALCSTLMEAVESEKDLDLSGIDLKNPSSAEIEIIKKIAESLSTCKEQFKFEGVTILIEYSGLMGAYSGDIICESTTSNERYVIGLTSRLSDCEKIVTKYLEQLKQLEYNALNNLYAGISKDLLGKPLNKLTESYLNTVISKYEATLDQLHLGDVHRVLVSCYDYYQQFTKLYHKISQLKLTEDDLKGIKECLTISDDTVTDKATKKAVEVLGKAQNNLTTILSEYVATGTVTPPEKGWPDMIVSMFKCPVSVAVYKGDQQVGFVGDDELWYDEEIIYAEERGGAKIIYSQRKDNISFVVTGTDEGMMSYTVEEYQDGIPTGRLNFNNIPVKEEQKFTATLQSSFSLSEATKDQFLLITGNTEIQANEYISASEDASVSIQAKASNSNMGIVWGDGSYVRGDAVVLYAIPENDYLFMGWYDETNTLVSISSTYEFSAQNDICLTALFMEAPGSEEEKQVYTITFDANSGTASQATMETGADGTLDTLPTASRDKNYRFDGWFTVPTGGTQITTDTVFDQDTTVYAHWSYVGRPADDDGHSSSGGSSSDPSYRIDVDMNVQGGDVTLRPTSASVGTRVTITANPDNGYEVDQVIVTDRNGKALTVTQRGENTYTFQMPDSRVSVEVTFTRLQQEEPVPTGVPFTDVAEDAWYYGAVSYVAQRGLMTGVSSNVFTPDATLTRAQLVQILYALEGRPAVSSASAFTDVASGAWYANAVSWAAASGVASGVGSGAFGPNDPLTREQLALILYRYAQNQGYDTTQGGMAVREFADYASISNWALEAVQWAVNAGLISGTGNGMLSPNGTATRAQVAVILMQFCQQVIGI